MTLTHGLIMFFIGVPLTVIGFFIAYTVASKTQKKPEELTEVQKSIEELNLILISLQIQTKDDVLDKILDYGIESLTKKEIEILNN